MINFSLKNEIVDSAEDVLHRRASTPIYGTFLISWLLFHWELIYTAFFVSQDHILVQTNMLKNDYLIQTFFNLQDWYFYASWILPLFLTWFVIWKLPDWVLLPAFEKDEEYRVKKVNTRLRLEKSILSEETKLVEQSAKKLEAEEKRASKQKSIEKTEPRILWEKEYAEFKSSSHYASFGRIVEAIYQHGGRIEWHVSPQSAVKVGIPKLLLAYAHTHELIELDKDKNNYQVIQLTEKGKFFVGKLTQEGTVQI